MNNKSIVAAKCVLLVALWFCLGAVDEFPVFRMPQFEEAIQDSSFLEQEATPPFEEIPRKSSRVGDVRAARLPVENVLIEGVVPYPALGITQDSVQEIVDRSLRDMQSVSLDENGFTPRDLLDIGRFLREIADRGTAPDQEDLNNLVLMTRRQEVQRTFITIDQLDSIAENVTGFYRRKGLILATAYIPQQEVADNVVKLRVLEGTLGEVVVTNNEIFAPEIITAYFKGEIGEPVTGQGVESTLRRINDLPGIRVRGSFRPGTGVGETSLNLEMEEEEAWSSGLILDNHGSETTGEGRLYATTEWLNIANKGHRLLLGVLRTEGPDSSTFGQVEYELPVTHDGRGRVRAGVSTNQFSVTDLGNLPKIIGETDNYTLSGSYQFYRGRTLNLKGELGYAQKDVLFEVGELTSLSSDQVLEVATVGAEFVRLWDQQELYLTGRLAVDQGHIISGGEPSQSTDFTKILFSMNMLKRLPFNNWLTKNERSNIDLIFKTNAQYAEKFLSSVEQFSLGGPNAVRAFGVSDVSVDSGVYAGFEARFALPIDPFGYLNLPLEPIRPFVFFDYAYGVQRTAGSGDAHDAVIKGFGLGFSLIWRNRVTANLVFAKPRSTSFEGAFSDAKGESRAYVDITYTVN